MNTNTSIPATAGNDSNSLITVSEVAEQVGREILESQFEPGAWATALYQCEGKRQDAIALYTQLRVRRLTKQRRVRLAKVRSFESRRIVHCMGDQSTRDSIARTIQAMLGNPHRDKSVNYVKPRLSIVWLAILFFGIAGTVSSLGRLFATLLPDFMANQVTMFALLAGAGAVCCAAIIRQILPKRWIMLGWNTGLVLTCNVVCLMSLFLGTKLIKRAIATDTVAFSAQQVSSPVKTTIVKPTRTAEPYLVSATTTQETGKN